MLWRLETYGPDPTRFGQFPCSIFPDASLKSFLRVFASPGWRCVLKKPGSGKDCDIHRWRCLKQDGVNFLLVSGFHDVDRPGF